jgi:hypothetical protein
MNKPLPSELKLVAGLLIFFIIFFMVAVPLYKPWAASQSGKAELAQANQNRQITVTEAEAEAEAAKSIAEAQIQIARAEAHSEIERARGVAEANAIIADSLKGNTDYLHYLWIQSLNSGGSEVIYIPTEAGLPLLEARER